jgi:hypothetical protein
MAWPGGSTRCARKVSCPTPGSSSKPPAPKFTSAKAAALRAMSGVEFFTQFAELLKRYPPHPGGGARAFG